MGQNIMELNENNFEELTKKGRWVIDFWAPWCGPCKIMSPHFEAAAKDLKGEFKFAKVNVDENSNIANKFDIMSVPTIVVLEDGEVVNATVGSMNKEQILESVMNLNQ